MKTGLKRIVRQATKSFGWEIRRFNPDLAVDTFVPDLLEDLRVNCVLDVGARIGEYGQMLRTRNYRGHIISIEPVEENYRQLQKQTASDSAWHAYQFALGSRNEATRMQVSQGTYFSSFLSPNDYGARTFPQIAAKQTELVRVRRLDNVFDELAAHIDQPRVYLKMDTQGWDLEVFRGAKDCRDRIVALQAEMSLQAIYEGMPDWREAVAEFQQDEFAVSAMFPVQRDKDYRLIEFDCVMVRT